MYTPSNGYYQDHYIFTSGFLWSGGGATQYVTGSSKFVKKSVVSFKVPNITGMPFLKKNIVSEDLWLEDHPFLSQLTNLMLGMEFQNPYQRFYFHLLLWSEKCIPKTCSSKRSFWPVLVTPAECLLLIGLLTIAFPSVYSPPRMPVTNEGL